VFIQRSRTLTALRQDAPTDSTRHDTEVEQLVREKPISRHSQRISTEMLQQPGGRPAPAARRISDADKEELIAVP